MDAISQARSSVDLDPTNCQRRVADEGGIRKHPPFDRDSL